MRSSKQKRQCQRDRNQQLPQDQSHVRLDKKSKRRRFSPGDGRKKSGTNKDQRRLMKDSLRLQQRFFDGLLADSLEQYAEREIVRQRGF